tara:strand:- start:136 stop:282 length:147 start_codon:yes stop_codon:yes gene_type:complete
VVLSERIKLSFPDYESGVLSLNYESIGLSKSPFIRRQSEGFVVEFFVL